MDRRDILDDYDDDTAIGDLDDALVAGGGDTDTTATGGEMELIDGSRSCDGCRKQAVCVVYANAGPMVEEQIPERTGGDPAFEAAELALICSHFEAVDE